MPDTTKILSATGNVCHQWSYLEYLISKAIWHILGLERDTGIIVTGGMDILSRVNMAIALAKHTRANKKLIEVLEETRVKIQGKRKTDGLMYRRNLIVHGVYSSRDNDPIILVETHRGAGDRKRNPISVAFVAQTGTDIFVASRSLIFVFEPLGISCH